MKTFVLALLATLDVIFVLAGLWALGAGLGRMVRASRMRRWPAVPGTILASTIASRESTLEAEEDGPPPRPITLYRAEVQYRYEVGGRSFTGSRIALDDVEVSSKSHAENLAQRYASGTAVTVHYNPEDPSQAVLEPGIHMVSWVLPAIGVAFLIVAGGFFLAIRWYSGRSLFP